MKTCDLHNHSTFSDGTQTPTELVAAAVHAGLSAVALTDHNTVAGIPEFMEAGKTAGIETVPGIEFSTDSIYGELHIVALFILPEKYDEINEILRQTIARSDQSKRDMVERLKSMGYDIDYDEIAGKTSAKSINRAHVARELTEKGYTTSINDAFDRLLDKKHGIYIEPKRIDALEAISAIRSMGAVSVLAHPFINLSEEQLREFLRSAVPCGLDAIEVEYSIYDAETTAKARSIAEEFGILPSGGSDSHGENKANIRIGCGKGNLAVPYEFYCALRAIHDERCRRA